MKIDYLEYQLNKARILVFKSLCISKIFFLYSATVLFFPLFVSAQNLDFNSGAELNQQTMTLEQNPKKAQGWNGLLRFEGMQYTTSLPDNPKLSQSQLVSAQLKYENLKNGFFGGKFDFSAGSYLGQSGSHFSLSEIFAEFKLNPNNILSVGRKLSFWSETDKNWQLGLWQSLFELDALRLQDQGLTGLHYELSNQNWNLLFFGSPIFIPTMGPNIQEEDGSLVADSRWYSQPSNSVPVFDEDTRLIYSIEMPDIKELIMQTSAAARLMYKADSGAWASVNFGRKPINKLLVQYEFQLNAPVVDSNGNATLKPSVGYHRLGGADLGFKGENSEFSVSYLQDSPEAKLPTGIWVLQNPEPMKSYSIHTKYSVPTPLTLFPVKVSLDYLKVTGGAISDFDANGIYRSSIFEKRTNFYNAVKLSGAVDTQLFSKKTIWNFSYLRDFDQKGTLIGTEALIFPKERFAFVVGADILGVDKPDENVSTDFLNQFRANDRYYGGVSYVF